MTPVEALAVVVIGVLTAVISNNDAEWPQPPEAAITTCHHAGGSVYMNGWTTICPEIAGETNGNPETPAEQEQEMSY